MFNHSILPTRRSKRNKVHYVSDHHETPRISYVGQARERGPTSWWCGTHRVSAERNPFTFKLFYGGSLSLSPPLQKRGGKSKNWTETKESRLVNETYVRARRSSYRSTSYTMTADHFARSKTRLHDTHKPLCVGHIPCVRHMSSVERDSKHCLHFWNVKFATIFKPAGNPSRKVTTSVGNLISHKNEILSDALILISLKYTPSLFWCVPYILSQWKKLSTIRQ